MEHSQADIPEDRFELMTAIIAILQPQESVSGALIRLGGQPSKQRRKARPVAGSSVAVGDAKGVEHLTSLANALMAQGVYDVYDVSGGGEVRGEGSAGVNCGGGSLAALERRLGSLCDDGVGAVHQREAAARAQEQGQGLL